MKPQITASGQFAVEPMSVLQKSCGMKPQITRSSDAPAVAGLRFKRAAA